MRPETPLYEVPHVPDHHFLAESPMVFPGAYQRDLPEDVLMRTPVRAQGPPQGVGHNAMMAQLAAAQQ